MSELIEDFGDFISKVNEKNKFEVEFEVNGELNTIAYSELSSSEEISVQKEFGRWYKDNYKDTTFDKDVSLQQFRFFKMIQKAGGMGKTTFDEFMAMPRLITSALAVSIEKDLFDRYPHIKDQINALR